MPIRTDLRVEDALIALQRAVSPEEVWRGSVKLMRAVMPVYNVLIGLPSLGITPMFMRATKPIPNVERFAQLAPLNDVVRDAPFTPVARMSDHFNPDSTKGRTFIEEFLKPMGWRYGAALLFWNPERGFIGQLAAIRTEKQGDFSEAEMKDLRALHPHVEAVVHRLFALENAFAAHLSLEHAIGALPLAIMVVGWEGKLSYSNAAAREAMSAWSSNKASARTFKPTKTVPPQVQAACEGMKREWEKAVLANNFTKAQRSAVVEHPSVRGLRAEIQLVESQAGRALQPSFAIHFALATSVNAETAGALARLSKLTQAQFEVARRAAVGDANGDIARSLGISLSTVRTHLRQIFVKLEISTRSRLAPLYQEFEVAVSGKKEKVR